ncbi:MAG: manganese efflux pump MntP family protein [Bacillota bacterium]
MTLGTLMALAVALGTDAFSMCLGIGMTSVVRRQIIIISLTVLAFHIAMPLIGWYIGELVGSLLGRAAAIAGALLLIYLGIRMIRSYWRPDDHDQFKILLLNSWGLLVLGASVSMDALSVGFTLGTRQADLLMTALVIGVVAGLMTLAGLLLGRYVGRRTGEKAVLLGGVILAVIGIRLFF